MHDRRNIFELENVTALTHGADSPRIVEARAAHVRRHVLESAPWLDGPQYATEVARFLRTETRALLLHEHIERVSSSQGIGKVSSRLWEQATAADRLAATLAERLGLSPRGYAELKSITAAGMTAEASLADAMAEGRAAMASNPAWQALDAAQDHSPIADGSEPRDGE